MLNFNKCACASLTILFLTGFISNFKFVRYANVEAILNLLV